MGVGLKKECIRSNATCVSGYLYEILDKGTLVGKHSVASDNQSFSVLGFYYIR